MNYSLIIIAVFGGHFAIAFNSHIENFNFPMGRAAVGTCRASGDQLADSDDIPPPIFTSTVYHFCFANASYPGGFYIIPMTCPPESYFNVTFQVCLEFDIDILATSPSTTDSSTTSITTDDSSTIPTSTVSGGSTASTVSGDSTASTVSGDSTASTVSGNSTASTVSGDSTASTVSGDSTASTVSGESSTSTVSESSAASTVSGNSSASTISGGSSVVMSSSTESSQPTPGGNTTECMETSTPSGGGMNNTITCAAEGRFPDPTDCTKYYICLLVGPNWYYFTYTCPGGTYFNSNSTACARGTCPAPPVAPTTPGCTPGVGTTGQMSNSTTTSAPMTTSGPRYSCASMMEGLYPDPDDCHMYYRCSLANGMWYYSVYTCPAGAYYDMVSQRCVAGTC